MRCVERADTLGIRARGRVLQVCAVLSMTTTLFRSASRAPTHTGGTPVGTGGDVF